jgi:hypothetical protein
MYTYMDIQMYMYTYIPPPSALNCMGGQDLCAPLSTSAFTFIIIAWSVHVEVG